MVIAHCGSEDVPDIFALCLFHLTSDDIVYHYHIILYYIMLDYIIMY